MKISPTTLAVLAAAILPASAVQYSLSVGNLSSIIGDTIITSSNGMPIGAGSGYVGIGSFASDPSSLAPDEIAEGFNVLLSSDMNASQLIGAPFPGMFFLTGDVDSADANVIEAGGRDVFVVFGNTSDLATATEIGVVHFTGRSFQADFAGPPPFGITGLHFMNQPPVHGAYGPGVRVTSDVYDVITGASFQLASVPEPSTALLLGFTWLGLSARRRR